jgi:hypothetical protein
MLAVIRPSDWEWPLFVHVLGAMLLVGALLAAVFVQLRGWKRREGTASVEGLAFRILLLGALPAFILMRIGAEWVASREGWSDVKNTPSWLDIGYITSDFGGVLVLVAIVLSGIAARRARAGGGVTLERISAVLATVVLVVYIVTIWAMTTKPS